MVLRICLTDTYCKGIIAYVHYFYTVACCHFHTEIAFPVGDCPIIRAYHLNNSPYDRCMICNISIEHFSLDEELLYIRSLARLFLPFVSSHHLEINSRGCLYIGISLAFLYRHLLLGLVVYIVGNSSCIKCECRTYDRQQRKELKQMAAL